MPSASAPILVEQPEQLDRLCRRIADYQLIAMDTEFMRTDTFTPRLALLQLQAGDESVLVDPLGSLDISRLWRQLCSAQHVCIMHSAKQDLEALWFATGHLPPALIDTQVCAALLGHPAQIGYAGLVSELLGIALDKSETRTDWTRRPLTSAQQQYAADDVRYLPELHRLLRQQLEDRGRYDWALEDSAALCDEALYRPDPVSAWQRLKRIPHLPPAEQARAIALCHWREERAVAANRPRQWILSDKAVLEIAARNPSTTDALGRLRELPAAVARKQASALLAVLESANADCADQPHRYQQQPVERNNSTLRKLSGRVAQVAGELGIAAEILASRRDLAALLDNPSGSRCLQGWRRAVIGEQLLAAVPVLSRAGESERAG